MRQPLPPRRSLRSAVAFAALAALGMVGAIACFGPDNQNIWVCLNAVTGKEDGTVYDFNHYVNGTFDPCHCYDPCGPEKTCPIVVDAGPPQPGCDAGDGGP